MLLRAPEMVRRKLDGAAPRAELVWEAGVASQRPGVPAFHQSWLLVTVYNQAWEDQGPPWPPKVPDAAPWEAQEGKWAGSTGSFCPLGGSRVAAEAGSRGRQQRSHEKSQNELWSLSPLQAPRLQDAERRGSHPTHRGHVDIVWVAWVVIGAGGCFCGLSLSCKNKHTEEWR